MDAERRLKLVSNARAIKRGRSPSNFEELSKNRISKDRIETRRTHQTLFSTRTVLSDTGRR